jgi:hypothetical protein
MPRAADGIRTRDPELGSLPRALERTHGVLATTPRHPSRPQDGLPDAPSYPFGGRPGAPAGLVAGRVAIKTDHQRRGVRRLGGKSGHDGGVSTDFGAK